MRIVTIGASPYRLTSRGVLNSIILKNLYAKDFPIASLVHSHDTNYFFPEEKDGKANFYYKFDHLEREHRIPIFPYKSGNDEVVAIYEILNALKPDLIIAIGDITDFVSIQAIKMFSSSEFKWLFVHMGYKLPVNENNQNLLDEMDGILCTSSYAYNSIKPFFHKELIDWCYVGCDTHAYQYNRITSKNKFRIMSCGKNVQTSNLPILIEAVSDLRTDTPEIELYLHTNAYDSGEHNLDILKARFDPKNEFIKFPDKYVSSFEGYSDNDFHKELCKSDIFVDLSMESATAQGLFRVMSSGCVPLVPCYGVYKEIVKKDYFLVKNIKVMTSGETYLYICDIEDLKKKIMHIYSEYKKGTNKGFDELTLKYDHKMFLKRVLDMIGRIKGSNKTKFLEEI